MGKASLVDFRSWFLGRCGCAIRGAAFWPIRTHGRTSVYEVIRTVFHYDRLRCNMSWNSKYFPRVRPPRWPLDLGALDGAGVRSVVPPFGQSERTIECPGFDVIHTIFHYDRVHSSMSWNNNYFPRVSPPLWTLDPCAEDGPGVRSVVLPYWQIITHGRTACVSGYTHCFSLRPCAF